MKRILTILCLMFLLPAPLFAQDFIFKTMRFFEGGYNAPEESQRKFTVQFPKSATRYVWCQIDVENRLYNVREQTHRVIWRYYNPDGTLVSRKQSNAMIETPEDVASHAVELAQNGIDFAGQRVRVDTLCLHGDHPRAALRVWVVSAA